MLDWAYHIDLPSLYKTLIISLSIIFITLIIFHNMWLKNPFFKRKQEKSWLVSENFYVYSISLLFQLDDHKNWLDQVGFEGLIKSIHVSSFRKDAFSFVVSFYIMVHILLHNLSNNKLKPRK